MFQDFFRDSLHATSGDELVGLFSDALAEYGFDRMVYTPLRGTFYGEAELPLVASTYPQDWLDHYASERYQDIDPVITETLFSRTPVVWSEIEARRPLTRRQKKLMSESRAAGIAGGVSVPLHGPFGEAWTLSVASSSPETVHLKSAMLVGPTHHFHACYMGKIDRPSPDRTLERLSRREQVVLTWAAQGKSNPQIAEILGVSTDNVKFHLSNIMTKLRASNRTVAVVTALKLGLIDP